MMKTPFKKLEKSYKAIMLYLFLIFITLFLELYIVIPCKNNAYNVYISSLK
jgi:hypothetical protein